ncbi:hypothetical protein [Emticicia agri]|uniref:hypothetical protein n=1 Tax=Emticicia agri TaxID=2492393 RepID=UPI0013E9AB74|nr:hypothetical protein [Emticicia agri]
MKLPVISGLVQSDGLVKKGIYIFIISLLSSRLLAQDSTGFASINYDGNWQKKICLWG